jgi:hypothetical protein
LNDISEVRQKMPGFPGIFFEDLLSAELGLSDYACANPTYGGAAFVGWISASVIRQVID